MSNLSILQQNTLLCFQHCEVAEKAYLDACDRLPEPRAFAFAVQVKQVMEIIGPVLKMSAQMHGLSDTPGDLLDFIVRRHWHRFKEAGAFA